MKHDRASSAVRSAFCRANKADATRGSAVSILPGHMLALCHPPLSAGMPVRSCSRAPCERDVSMRLLATTFKVSGTEAPLSTYCLHFKRLLAKVQHKSLHRLAMPFLGHSPHQLKPTQGRRCMQTCLLKSNTHPRFRNTSCLSAVSNCRLQGPSLPRPARNEALRLLTDIPKRQPTGTESSSQHTAQKTIMRKRPTGTQPSRTFTSTIEGHLE